MTKNGIKYSSEAVVAAEKQILDLQKATDYSMKEGTIEELLQWHQTERESDNNKLFVPKEHRSFVWDEARQLAFIESLLMGLPIPYFFVGKVKGGRFALVDGLQRLKTLEAFVGNQLILNHLKKLTLLNGFKFQDLPLSRQRRFKTRIVRLIELSDKVDSETRQELFSRFNQ